MEGLDFTLAHILGLAAGALILILGAFVLAARPSSWLHRGFFGFAMTDGVSTLLFELRGMAQSEAVQLYAMYGYFATFILFLAFFIGFGLLFPRPFLGHPRVKLVVIGLVVVSAATLLAYFVDYRLFWRALDNGPGGTIQWRYTRLGTVVVATYVLTTALVLIRMTRQVLLGAAATRRRQAAFVLGGMAMGFAPYATVTTVTALIPQLGDIFANQPWTVQLIAVSYILTTLTVVATALILLFARRSTPDLARRFVLVSLFGVATLTLVTLVNPNLAAEVQVLGLLVYPALLGFAIIRFGVLDIDERLRRAATISLVTSGLAVTFLTVEEFLENVLADRVFGSVDSSMGSSILAALAAALLAFPLVHYTRRGVARVAPELGQDAFASRRLDIYRHALHGALEDGVIDVMEQRTIARLRESLSITEQEHQSIRREFGAVVTVA